MQEQKPFVPTAGNNPDEIHEGDIGDIRTLQEKKRDDIERRRKEELEALEDVGFWRETWAGYLKSHVENDRNDGKAALELMDSSLEKFFQGIIDNKDSFEGIRDLARLTLQRIKEINEKYDAELAGLEKKG